MSNIKQANTDNRCQSETIKLQNSKNDSLILIKNKSLLTMGSTSQNGCISALENPEISNSNTLNQKNMKNIKILSLNKKI